MSDAVCFSRHGFLQFQWEIKTMASIADSLGNSKENTQRRNISTLFLYKGNPLLTYPGRKGLVCAHASWLSRVNQR